MLTCLPGNTGNQPLSDDTCFGNCGGTYTSEQMANCTQEPTVDEYAGWTYGEVENPVGGVVIYVGMLDKLPCFPVQPGGNSSDLVKQ
jgi:hypothetical protein